MTGQLASFDMTAKPIASIFEPPSIGMPNPYSGGGSTFSGIEGLLMDYAMSDAMGSAQQNAKQKVSGVMSGIQSLVSEAFPNFSMGTGSGTVGGGNFNPTPSPVPFADPPAIPSTPMQPPMMGDLSQISTPLPIEGGGGIGLPPMVGGSGMGNPLLEPPMIPKIADIGPVTANPTPKVSVEESGPVFQDTYNPAVTTIDDILAGQGGFPKIGADVGGPVTSEEAYNPAMEYFNPISPMPIQKQVEDPLINLAYNFNMENSPF